MYKFSLILAVSGSILSAGCAFNTKENVTYIEAIRTIESLPHAERNIHIFVDRNGDIYPPSEAGITRTGMESWHKDTRSEDYASLRRHVSNPRNREAVFAFVNAQLAAHGGCSDHNVSECWKMYQEHLKKETASRIKGLSAKYRNSRIIVLIHGYNNDYFDARNWYDLVASHIHQKFPETLFIRVHWDGLEQPIPIGIWGNAQRNGPLAGVGLRPVFRWVNDDKPGREIVVITHSTGVLVAAALLGDSSAPLPGQADALSSTANLPNANFFRLGLLIPAAATNTFNNYIRDKNSTSNDIYNKTPARLILGLNRKDGPTNKYLLSCRASGDTCMNTDARAACSNIKKAFSSVADFDSRFRLYEFSRMNNDESATASLWEDHAVSSQMTRPKWNSFISALLLDTSPPADDADQACER